MLPSQLLKVTFQLLRNVVEINNPTLRLLKLPPYLDSKLESSDFKSDAYPLGHRDDRKSGRRMIKIPINVFSSCQRAVSLTILPGIEP